MCNGTNGYVPLMSARTTRNDALFEKKKIQSLKMLYKFIDALVLVFC